MVLSYQAVLGHQYHGEIFTATDDNKHINSN